MTNPYRALIAELVQELERYQWDYPAQTDKEAYRAMSADAALERARELLAEPEAEGPSASDVTELFYRHMGEGSEVGFENAIAEALARYGRPAAPPVPEPGEVAGIAEWLRANALTVQKASGNPANGAKQRMNHAAELLSQRHPTPVPVGERPWERQGWCDKDGRCWFGWADEPDASWSFCKPSERDTATVSLPANALPTPEVTND